jgi:chemotaxis protein MotB
MGPLFAQMANQMVIVGHTDSVPYADWLTPRSRAGRSPTTARWPRARSSSPAACPPRGSCRSWAWPIAPIDTLDAAAAVNRHIELIVLTEAQARNVAAMFGMPGEVQPLTADLDRCPITSLQALRAPVPATHRALTPCKPDPGAHE